MRTPVLVLAVVLALAGAACSDGGDGNEPNGPARDCVDLTTEGASFTIRMRDNEFVPACFTASASQALTLVNEDGGLHSFTMEGTEVDIDIAGGETLNLDPIEGRIALGTYQLICKYHLPGMTGEVTVVE